MVAWLPPARPETCPGARPVGGRRPLCGPWFALAVGLGAAGPMPAWAGSWQGVLTLASEYLERGQQRSGGRPAALLDLHLLGDGGGSVSAGLAVPGPGEGRGQGLAQLALAQAWTREPDTVLQLGLTRYAYLGDADVRAYDYTEVSARYAQADRWQAVLYWTPALTAPGDAAERVVPAWSLEFDARLTPPGSLPADATLWAGLGARWPRGVTRQAYGSLGLQWPADAWRVYLTAVAGSGERGVRRVVLALQRPF